MSAPRPDGAGGGHDDEPMEDELNERAGSHEAAPAAHEDEGPGDGQQVENDDGKFLLSYLKYR